MINHLTYGGVSTRDFNTWISGEAVYDSPERDVSYITGQLSPKTTSENREGTFELAFNCKPYRYLKSGEVPETFTASGSILNRTLYDAAPLIRVYGKGNLGIPTHVIIDHMGGLDEKSSIMAEYYGIGEKRLRGLIAEQDDPGFILEVGTHVRIKRKRFEEYLDEAIVV